MESWITWNGDKCSFLELLIVHSLHLLNTLRQHFYFYFILFLASWIDYQFLWQADIKITQNRNPGSATPVELKHGTFWHRRFFHWYLSHLVLLLQSCYLFLHGVHLIRHVPYQELCWISWKETLWWNKEVGTQLVKPHLILRKHLQDLWKIIGRNVSSVLHAQWCV